MKLTRPLMLAIACALPLAASAQWQWIDKDGHRVFSDRAPPSDIPDKNILRQPSQRGRLSFAPAPAAPVAATPASGAKGTGADKELNEKKKQAEDAEAAKRKADEERIARVKADNCARARQAKMGLDAGGRMTRINEQGEREYLDDSARAAESQRLQGIIDQDCR